MIPYTIPLFDLNFDKKEEQAVLEVLQSKWISTGPKSKEFEEKFAGMLNVNHAVALSNCTVALHLALKLVGVEKDDEVICPSLTFVATVNAIRYVDAIPVFADVKSPEEPTINPEEIQRLISPRTKVIMVMHYGGFACDMDRIMEIARQHDLKVIEDACHGPMSEYSPRGIVNDLGQSNNDNSRIPRGKGKKLGTIGDIGCFSFFSNKNISTGEGGMLVTNNEEYGKRAGLLRSHGMTTLSYERAKGHSTAYDVVELGYNYRMDDIRAALGVVQLDKLMPDLEKRAQVRQWYIKALAAHPGIIIPFRDYPYFSSNYIFPIVLKDAGAQKRDEIRNKLAVRGIQTSMHYPAVHRFLIYKDYYRELEVTDYLVNNMITLPMFAKLNYDNINYITKTLINKL